MSTSDSVATRKSENAIPVIGELDVVDSYEDADKEAEEIWKSGKAFKYIYDSCEKYHKGNYFNIKFMILSYVCTRILNSNGLQISLNGKAGTGKSHLSRTVAAHLPPGTVIFGRFSDKALVHKEDLTPGHIICTDDQAMTDTFEEIFKEISSDFHSPFTYHSVNKAGKSEILVIPPETVFWSLKQELQGDEQTQDRQLILNTEDSVEQLESIKTNILENAKDPRRVADDYSQVVSQRIWKFVPTKAYISIPFTDEISTGGDVPDPRNLNSLLSLVYAVTLLNAHNRERATEKNDAGEVEDITINGYEVIEATRDDFMIAAKLMNRILCGKGGSQKHKVGQNGEKILALLREEYADHLTDEPIPYKEIGGKLGLSPQLMTYAINGRNNRNTDGLCSICPAIESVTMAIPNRTQGGSYSGKGILWNYREYLRWDGRSETYALIKDGKVYSPKVNPEVLDDMIKDENEEIARDMQNKSNGVKQ